MADVPVKSGDILDGKYRVERVLGSGGMGVVVAARHLQLEQIVALKFLLPEARKDGEVVARFAREAKASARIKSDHVARVIDVGKMEDGAPYMVMEYLEGRDMRQVLEEHGPLPLNDAVDYILEVCEALAEAHGHGIVHRDLKPANIFLAERSGKRPIIKVLDFGISKLVDDNEGTDLALTKTMSRLGSPLYMSPEQMTSPKHVDHRTDVWALGVILYEFLTGQRPFRGDSVAMLIVSILNSSPEPPSRLRPDLPEALQTAILRCLAKDPLQRFESVGALAAELLPWSTRKDNEALPEIRRYLEGPGSAAPSARPPASTSSARPPLSRPSGRVSEGGPSGAILPTTLSQSWKSVQASPDMDDAPTKRGWSSSIAVAVGIAALVLIGLRAGGPSPGTRTEGSTGTPDDSKGFPPTDAPSSVSSEPATGKNEALLGVKTSPPPLDAGPTVRVRLSASPANATVILDGTPLPSNPFDTPVPQGKTKHTLRAEAPGHRPRETPLFFEQNGAFHLVLEKEGSEVSPHPIGPANPGIGGNSNPQNMPRSAADPKDRAGNSPPSSPSPRLPSRSIDEESPYSQ